MSTSLPVVRPALALALAAGLATAPAHAQVAPAVTPTYQEWSVYGGDPGGSKYSTLADIQKTNVKGLKVAWEWRPEDLPLEQFGTRPGNFQTTPLMIDNVLYVSTQYNRVVALEPETGKTLWAFDPKTYEDGQPANGTGYVHRGVSAWRDSRDGNRLRIFLATRWRLFCLDAATGVPVKGFGTDGWIDLT